MQAQNATLAWLAAGRDAPFTLSEMMRTTHLLGSEGRCVPIDAHGWFEALAWCRCVDNAPIVLSALIPGTLSGRHRRVLSRPYSLAALPSGAALIGAACFSSPLE